jgi:mannose-6-phosphate isomerase-like protein (cupin superfamily)
MPILDNEGWQLHVKADSSRKNLLRGLDRYWKYVSGIGRGSGKSPLCGPEAAKILPLESSMQTINRREAVGALSVFALMGKIAEPQTSAGAGPVPFQIIKFDSLAVAHNHTNGSTGRNVPMTGIPKGDIVGLHFTTLEPGQSMGAVHKNSNHEIRMIHTGKLELVIDGRPVQTAEPGDVVVAPANEPYTVRNGGAATLTYFTIQIPGPKPA